MNKGNWLEKDTLGNGKYSWEYWGIVWHIYYDLIKNEELINVNMFKYYTLMKKNFDKVYSPDDMNKFLADYCRAPINGSIHQIHDLVNLMAWYKKRGENILYDDTYLSDKEKVLNEWEQVVASLKNDPVMRKKLGSITKSTPYAWRNLINKMHNSMKENQYQFIVEIWYDILNKYNTNNHFPEYSVWEGESLQILPVNDENYHILKNAIVSKIDDNLSQLLSVSESKKFDKDGIQEQLTDTFAS